MRSPGQFDRFRRQNGWRQVNGKALDVIWGVKSGTTSLQSFRYRLSEGWTASQARSHCNNNDGILFEPAVEDNSMTNINSENPFLDLIDQEETIRYEELEGLDAYVRGSADAPVLYRSSGYPISFRADSDSDPDPDSQVMEFVASEESEDRFGDVIEVKGWQLANFRKNPVFLFGHNNHVPPVGRVVKVGANDTRSQLLASVDWDMNDPLAALLRDKYANKYMRAVSVGFRPLEFKEKEDGKGIRFLKQELLEISAVPIPAHPKALKKAFQMWTGWSDVEALVSVKAPIRSHSTPKAEESAPWDAGAELRKAEGAAVLKRMHAWVDTDMDPETRQAYKLPHHRIDGTLVWRPTAQSMSVLMGARGGVKVPEGDRRGIYDHLSRHYKQFGKQPPEFKDYESGTDPDEEMDMDLAIADELVAIYSRLDDIEQKVYSRLDDIEQKMTDLDLDTQAPVLEPETEEETPTPTPTPTEAPDQDQDLDDSESLPDALVLAFEGLFASVATKEER